MKDYWFIPVGLVCLGAGLCVGGEPAGDAGRGSALMEVVDGVDLPVDHSGVSLIVSELADPEIPSMEDLSHGEVGFGVKGGEVGSSGLELPETDLLHGEAEVRREPEAAFRLRVKELHRRLEAARNQRRVGNYDYSKGMLESLWADLGEVPDDLRRAVSLERALVLQDSGDWVRAQNQYLAYTAEFKSHPSRVEVQLRQGLLYREMGMMSMALAKFQGAVSSALDLRMGDLERMERLVLRAKAEVGETYFLQGMYVEAASSFGRLLKQDSPLLNREALSYKLIQSLHRAQDAPGAVEQGQRFLVEFVGSEMEPEVRYILAKEYRLLGRAVDAKREILSLLQAESERSRKDPSKWIYWQKLAGNEMANQLYAEGDFVATRTVYEHLAALDHSAAWQVPVWYQLGLVYERLGQRAKALEMYSDVLERETELTGANLTPSLRSVIEMARWRKDAVGWMEKAEGEIASLRQGPEK